MHKQSFFRKYHIVLCSMLFCCTAFAEGKKPLRVLHMSFHQGCINDFDEVGRALGLEVVSWHILLSPLDYFDGETKNLTIYNITHDRAEKVWNKHKKFFDTFDVIITSDIAPLARIFLQNKWSKPLIVWICNRFDYYMEGTIKGFPDQELYDLFNRAALQKNVKVVSYTSYEHIYAHHKGVDFDTYTIKPIGSLANANRRFSVPRTVKKNELLFVYPLDHSEDDKNADTIKNECDKVGIATYTGRFNGPGDLQDFKGIIYLPYQVSSLIFWEAIQKGIIFFVPSKKFLRSMIKRNMIHEYCLLPNGIVEFVDWMEWYAEAYQDLMVYFDSWQDLKEKIDTIDYAALHARILRYAQYHRETVLHRWKEVFQGFTY
jgi:hypothetical protein